MFGTLLKQLGGTRRKSRSRKNRKSRRRRSYRGGGGEDGMRSQNGQLQVTSRR